MNLLYYIVDKIIDKTIELTKILKKKIILLLEKLFYLIIRYFKK